MRNRYQIFFTACLFFIGISFAHGQTTVNFDSQPTGGDPFSEGGATFNPGTASGVIAPGNTTFIASAPNGFRTFLNSTSTIVFDNPVTSISFFFTHQNGATGTATATSNADCTSNIPGATANSNIATTQGDPNNIEELTIPDGQTARCVIITTSGAGNVASIIDDFTFEEAPLPVELAAFSGVAEGQAAVLRWETLSETNNMGFEVERLDAGSYVKAGFVEAAGKANSYAYRVEGLEPGIHSFRLKQMDLDGSVSYSAAIEVAIAVPGEFHLSSAYPNPFNPTTSFTLTVQRDQDVRIEVYDLLGRNVATLFEGAMAADDTQTFRFDATGLSSGLFLIRVTGENFVSTRQVTLLK